jgi:hypothetical protein
VETFKRNLFRRAWLDEALAEFIREIFVFDQRVSVKQAAPERAAT